MSDFNENTMGLMVESWTMLLTSCVTLNKLLSLSGPFSQLEKKTSNDTSQGSIYTVGESA